jgi:hypothetical protein
MIRTFKWIYNLGVEQERVRIARVLEQEAHRRSVVATVGTDMLINRDRDGTKMSDKRKQRLELETAVADEVKSIVLAIIEPHAEHVIGSSILFPNTESKLTKEDL